MIEMNDRQMDGVRRAAVPARLEKMANDVRRAHPAELARVPQPALLALVDDALKDAEMVGLRWDSSRFAFARLAAVIAPGFFHHPTIAGILQERDDIPDRRLKRLVAMVPDTVWQEARAYRRDGSRA